MVPDCCWPLTCCTALPPRDCRRPSGVGERGYGATVSIKQVAPGSPAWWPRLSPRDGVFTNYVRQSLHGSERIGMAFDATA